MYYPVKSLSVLDYHIHLWSVQLIKFVFILALITLIYKNKITIYLFNHISISF